MTLVTPADLGVYLGVEVEQFRAQMLIDDAVAQAVDIVGVADEGKLPASAAGIIRGAVARLYLNPAGVTQEMVGPLSYSRPASSGSIFSRAEKSALVRGAGRGAFSVDLLPAGYEPVLPRHDVG